MSLDKLDGNGVEQCPWGHDNSNNNNSCGFGVQNLLPWINKLPLPIWEWILQGNFYSFSISTFSSEHSIWLSSALTSCFAPKQTLLCWLRPSLPVQQWRRQDGNGFCFGKSCFHSTLWKQPESKRSIGSYKNDGRVIQFHNAASCLSIPLTDLAEWGQYHKGLQVTICVNHKGLCQNLV